MLMASGSDPQKVIIPPGYTRFRPEYSGREKILLLFVLKIQAEAEGFMEIHRSIQLKTETGIIHLGDQWQFRIAKMLNNGIGVGPNDFPCLLYNAMIHPLIPYRIRGVLWYQGEANADRAYQYRIAFPLLITDWRQQWGEGNFPFYFVQLASFNAANGNSASGSTWAELREAQSNTLALPATGMCVTTDIGESNDIHPKNKQDVGLRLAAIALDNIYRSKDGI